MASTPDVKAAVGALRQRGLRRSRHRSPRLFPPGVSGTGNGYGDDDEEEDADRVLLVQRAPHDSMPLRWEVPGGACDDEDETVLHAVARELWEESGLRAAHIGPQVGSEGMVFFTRRGRRMLRVSFLADVEAGAAEEGRDGDREGRKKKAPPVAKLDPEEHVAFLWATEDECRRHRVGETEIKFTHASQEQTILKGFRLRRELRAQAAS
ncbi:hypothetical protein PG994_009025 [Apiospora phragmitis]|uniref:Nudix hydrolase domain-containing protein n=1 Tax=Apiospora phragmitis TaxID=2905665 RepID=A0ABR1UI49_9PEZI